MVSPRGFRRATVTRVVEETTDARTFVLTPHDGPFDYRAGQFCTFRVTVAGQTLLRSYSMSSAPEVDGEFMTTVKRVPGGAVSNWLHDHLVEGDEVEITTPAGGFCLRDGEGPVLGFAGGSGITPILSLAKSALATTDRRVRLLCADRDPSSAIFASALSALVSRHPERLQVVRHFDSEHGIIGTDALLQFIGADGVGDAYLCGPDPFMALVEKAFPGPGRVFSEKFTPVETTAEAPDATTVEEVGTIGIQLGRKKVSVPRRTDETLLESARRAGLSPPFSCESGTCATCIARLVQGEVTMRNNEILEDDEIEEGWVLTCQSVPVSPSVVVRYED